MITHIIYNPNNIIIIKDNFVAIPIGHRCSSALSCNYAKIRNCSLPFDWTRRLYPSKIINCIENNFKDFVPDVKNNIMTNKYNIKLEHFNSNRSVGIEEYKRRIPRFIEILNNNKIKYFIFINEDYYYDKEYRQKEFTNKIFLEMLNFESFLKKTYSNINYRIIYIDFEKHLIPSGSNIINIILKTKKLYKCNGKIKSSEKTEAQNIIRKKCGKIILELFK